MEAYAPTTEVRELRRNLQGRLALVRSRTRFKNNIHAFLLQNNLKPPVEELFTEDGLAWLATLENARIPRYLRLIDAIHDELDDVDAELATLANEYDETRLLKTIPGVGNFTALVLHAWIGDVNRFPTGESLAHYSGLTPTIDASGDTVKTGHVTREGRASCGTRWSKRRGSTFADALRAPHRRRSTASRRRKARRWPSWPARVGCSWWRTPCSARRSRSNSKAENSRNCAWRPSSEDDRVTENGSGLGPDDGYQFVAA